MRPLATKERITANKLDDPQNLTDLLLRSADQHPSRGLRYIGRGSIDTSRHQPYPELLDTALRLLGGLQRRDLPRGHKVALLLTRQEDFLPAFWACVLGGYVPCPLAPVESDAQRWAAQLEHVNALLDRPLFLTDAPMRAKLPDVSGLAIALLDMGEGPAQLPAAVAEPDDLALLVLTSGSTGSSKAVMLTHGNLLAAMTAKTSAQQLGPDDVTLNWISYDHVAALLEAHLLPLAVGADQLHALSETVLSRPSAFLDIIDRYRVSMTFAPNFMLGLINKELEQRPPRDDMDLSCLKRIVSGGEANVVRTGVNFLGALAARGLGKDVVWPAFGMTETCAGSIYNSDFPAADEGQDFASLGFPVQGLQLRTADSREGRALPEGSIGEVQLKGPMITTGYYNNPAATEDAFTSDGWYRTGDLGRVVAGRLTLIGRLKDSIIVNGVNYFSHDMESTLESVTGVEKSYVAVFPTRTAEHDTEQLVVAFATSVSFDDEPELHRLIIAIRNSVTLYWGFRPNLILPLPKEAFPKTSLGKIQRNLLRTRLEHGQFAEAQRWASDVELRQIGGYSAPEDETERELVRIYSEMFDKDPAMIGATASFYDLGGTSLDILRLRSKIEASFGFPEIALLTLLRSPSARELAREIERGGQVREYDPIVPLQTTGEKTPLFCVHPGVGEVLVFVNLAKYFAHERPFYALRARGFDPGEELFGSVDEMVQTYVSSIRARQPHGPYAIAGYSYGAVIAFEIVKKLEAAGERVDFVGCLDLPPHIKHHMNRLDLAETATHLALFLDLVNAQFPAPSHEWSEERQMRYLVDHASPERLAELDLDVAKFTAWAKLAHGLTTLGRTYEPSGAVESLSVFYADPLSGTKQDWLEDELKRWDEHARGTNRYIEVDGTHYTLMGPKHVATFQAALRKELDRALRGR